MPILPMVLIHDFQKLNKKLLYLFRVPYGNKSVMETSPFPPLVPTYTEAVIFQNRENLSVICSKIS